MFYNNHLGLFDTVPPTTRNRDISACPHEFVPTHVRHVQEPSQPLVWVRTKHLIKTLILNTQFIKLYVTPLLTQARKWNTHKHQTRGCKPQAETTKQLCVVWLLAEP